MAMIIPGESICPICGKIIQLEESIFTTWGIFIEPENSLSSYFDSGMHWDCYAGWE